MTPSRKDCIEMLDYFILEYKRVHHKRPVVNRHTARWGFEDILSDMSKEQATSLIDYYFRTPGDHNISWLFYHYDELMNNKTETENDAASKKILLEQTKRRVEEWRKKID